MILEPHHRRYIALLDAPQQGRTLEHKLELNSLGQTLKGRLREIRAALYAERPESKSVQARREKREHERVELLARIPNADPTMTLSELRELDTYKCQRRKEREQERSELLAKHPTESPALTLTELRALDKGKTSQQKAKADYYDRNKAVAALQAHNAKLEARIQALEALILPPLT